MDKETPLAEMLISEVLNRWPQTAEVFHCHNMACVGCPVAPYYSINDATNVYGLSLAEFVAELEESISVQASKG